MTTDQQFQPPEGRAYVLMTAAYNEEAYIEKTIQTVLSQTLLPRRWVIVSDNSSDRTDEIVEGYTKQHKFMRFLRVTRAPGRSFRSKVLALQSGAKLLADANYQFIGNIDADISVDPNYFEELIGQFERYPALGLCGGFIHEERAGRFANRPTNSPHDVAHGAQLVRRECYEAIGGYAVLKHGGEDWHAQTSARMKGWEVASIPALTILHYRRSGAGDRHVLRDRFRQGRLDHSFGSNPIFEVVKCLRRIPEKPYVIAATTRLVGFAWGYLSAEPLAVSDEFAAFLRKEQKSRIVALLGMNAVTRSDDICKNKPNAFPSIDQSAPK